MTPIKPGPFQIGTHEDRARRPCRSPAALQGLSGIGIPNRKTPARHTGPLCSIRGKSGGGRSGGEPYVGLGKLAANRNLVGLRGLLLRLWSFFLSSTLAHSNWFSKVSRLQGSGSSRSVARLESARLKAKRRRLTGGTFVLGSETHADPSFLRLIVFWLCRCRGMMMLVRGVSL